MSGTIHKALIFMKRRPGLSVEAFRDYYETHHVKLCEPFATGALRYVRRYLDPVGDEELPFDVITEIWLADARAYAMVLSATAGNAPPPHILEDEMKLFDRDKLRVAGVIECESDLDAVRRAGERGAAGED